MKIRYYFMSMVVACTAMVGFTSCDDDDDDLAPVNVIVPGENGGDYQITSDTVRVKVGEENRIALPVANGAEIRGFSLDESVVKVVETPQGMMLEGVSNGTAVVKVTDAGYNIKQFVASVYTTDVMELNKTEILIEAPLGEAATNNECAVVLGNGQYTITSDNENVTPDIDANTGEIVIIARGRVEDYTATLTVKDVSSLTATITVNVHASLDGFTPEAIADILAKTSSDVWAQGEGIRSSGRPSYFGWGSYGAWVNEETDGVKTVGWWMNQWGSDYGGLRIEYPAIASVGEEVDGKFFFQYGHINYNSLLTFDTTVKVLEDNDTRTVVIAWQIDRENERINKAYVVHYK